MIPYTDTMTPHDQFRLLAHTIQVRVKNGIAQVSNHAVQHAQNEIILIHSTTSTLALGAGATKQGMIISALSN